MSGLTTSAARALAVRVVVPGFHGTEVAPWLGALLDEGLAGVCWFAQNVGDRPRDLADAIHARHPGAVVMSDEEGGAVTRLSSDPAGSRWPGAGTLGLLDDLAATHDVHHALGVEARAAGVDLVLGPVADVNSDPRNPVIGVRSFGDRPERVAAHVAAAVGGLQQAGVAACAKHFPGHGATRTDSHLGLPVLDDPLAVLRERDLPPFAAAVEAGVQAVMTAHVVLSAIEDRPATLSRRALDLLRHDLGFEGVIVSDALDMHAISRSVGRGPGAVAALAAGVDLICIGNPEFPEHYDDEAVCAEVVDAVAGALLDGTLPRERVEQAAARTAGLAAWVHAAPAVPAPDLDAVLTASRALAVEGPTAVDAPLVLALGDRVEMAAGRRGSAFVEGLAAAVPGATAAAVADADALADLLADLLADGPAAPGRRDVVAVVSAPYTPGAPAETLLDALLAARPDAVVIDAGPAGRPSPARAATRRIATRGGGRAVLDAVARRLSPPPQEDPA